MLTRADGAPKNCAVREHVAAAACKRVSVGVSGAVIHGTWPDGPSGNDGGQLSAAEALTVVTVAEPDLPGRLFAPVEAARRFHVLILPRGVVILQSPWQDAGMPYKQDPNVVPTTVRLPRQLLERIDEIAASERRSRNQMMILLLERATKPQ